MDDLVLANHSVLNRW